MTSTDQRTCGAASPAARIARKLLLRWAPRLFLRCCRVDRAQLGLAGEELAARSLLRLGWSLRARRVRTAAGEVDLWAERGSTCLVVEVKTGRLARRARPSPGAAPEAAWDLRWRPGGSLGFRQRRRLFRAARALARRSARNPQVALIEVFVAPDGGAVLVLPPRRVPEPGRAPYTRGPR